MKNEKGDRMGLMEKILGDMNTKEVKKKCRSKKKNLLYSGYWNGPEGVKVFT